MAAYTLEFVKSARKEFERLPAKARDNAAEALRLLSQNPYSELLKVKKLRGASDLYRIRFGDYRLLYELRNDVLVVLVIKIGHRREIYSR